MAALLSVNLAYAAAARPPSLYRAMRGVSIPALVGLTGDAATTFVFAPRSSMLTPAFAHRLHAEGVEFVRLVVNPAPLLFGEPGAAANQIDVVESSVAVFVSAGVAVVVDMHFWPNVLDAQDRTLRDSAQLSRYAAALQALAARLAAQPIGAVALELMNEPPTCEFGKPTFWPAVQRRLLGDIRRVSRALPVVLTGCGGQTSGLLSLSPAPNDPAALYTFHFYEPFIYTHQAAYYGLEDYPLEFPARYTPDPDVLMKSVRNKPQRRSYAVNDVEHYLRDHNEESLIDRRLDAVSDWARAHGIAADHLFLGEFGAAIGPDPGDGKPRASALRWLEKVRRAADRNQIKHAFWSYPTQLKDLNYDEQTGGLRRDVARAAGVCGC